MKKMPKQYNNIIHTKIHCYKKYKIFPQIHVFTSQNVSFIIALPHFGDVIQYKNKERIHPLIEGDLFIDRTYIG